MQQANVERLTPVGEMTIYNALETKARLLAALEGCAELELDLSQVTEIDTAGFQLLLLAKKTACKDGKALRLVAHSAAVRDVLDLYDMATFFGDPMVIPAHE
ncbi:MAG: STAS domain-containing protein [Pseudomonadota bacterium]